MIRSKSGICVSMIRVAGFSPLFFAAVAEDDLATVAPCDDESEDDVQAAEGDAEEDVCGTERQERSESTEEHEADAHHRDHAHRKRAAADEGRAVQKQPRCRNR